MIFVNARDFADTRYELREEFEDTSLSPHPPRPPPRPGAGQRAAAWVKVRRLVGKRLDSISRYFCRPDHRSIFGPAPNNAVLAVLPCTTPPKCAQAKGLWSLTQACGCALAAWPATMWRLCGERPRGDAREPRGARRLYRYSTRYLQGISRDLAPRLRDSISPPWASTSPPQTRGRCCASRDRCGGAGGRAKRAQAASGAATRLHACTNLR